MRVSELFEDTDQITSIIKKYCPKNFELLVSGKAPPLYRGTTQEHQTEGGLQFFYALGHSTPRKSLTGNSVFMSYVSESPAWVQYPKRTLSTFCSASSSQADAFGHDVHLIIPADAVGKIASCPQDFNEVEVGPDDSNFLDLGSSIEHLLQAIKYMAGEKVSAEVSKLLNNPALKMDVKKAMSMSDLSAFSEAIDDLCSYLNNRTISRANARMDELMDAVEHFIDTFDAPLLAWMQEYVTPENMEAKRYRGYEGVKGLKAKEEVWFQGGYLAVAPESGVNARGLLDKEWFRNLGK